MELNWASETLKTSRKRAGLTQRVLFQRSGVAQSTISLIETGELQPTIPVLQRLVHSCAAELTMHAVPRDGKWSAFEAAEVARKWNDLGDEDLAIRAGIQLRDDLMT